MLPPDGHLDRARLTTHGTGTSHPVLYPLIRELKGGPPHHASTTLSGHPSNHHTLPPGNPKPSNPAPRSRCLQEATRTSRRSSCHRRTDTPPASCTLMRSPQLLLLLPPSSRSRSRRSMNRRRRCGRRRGRYAHCGGVRVANAALESASL